MIFATLCGRFLENPLDWDPAHVPYSQEAIRTTEQPWHHNIRKQNK